MKRIVISIVAAMTVMAGSAQDLQSIQSIARSKANHAAVSSVATKHHQLSAGKVADVKNSRRALKDGVYYARPEGAFWNTGYVSDTKTYQYLILPPFTDVTFPNMCTAKDQATWAFGTNSLAKFVDENQNLVYSFDKSAYGYVMYAPTISVGQTSYQIADFVLVQDSVPIPLHPFNYVKGGRYYGYGDGASPFMSGLDSFDFNEDGQDEPFKAWAFRQYFEKPINPLYLHEVSMWATTKDKNFTGEKLKAVFNKVNRDEKGNRTVGDVIATMDCTIADVDTAVLTEESQVYFCDLTFACQKADEFGTMTAHPILLDDEYAITITGINEEGVDIRFYFTDQGENDEEFETASPTYIMPADLDGNHIEMKNGNGLSYYGKSKNGNYCYSLVFYFVGEMDGLSVEPASYQLLAGEEGGEAMAMVEGYNDGVPAYVYTNYPMYDTLDGDTVFAGRYAFDGVPEWARIQIDPSYYEYATGTDNEIRGLHLVWFEVQALPVGENGRMAIVNVISALGEALGATSKYPILILQGDVEVPAGVKALKFDAQGKFVGSYNMNGQRVNDNQKGLVIRNGKKVIKK